MDNALHLLLERWENHIRDHPDADIDDSVDGITAEFDRATTDRFRMAVEKLNRMDRRLKRIGVDSRESG
jgi:hypothetical protein